MEIVTMESAAFKILVEKIDQIATHIKERDKSQEPPNDEVLTRAEVCNILQISISTLYRLRKSEQIDYIIVKGRCMYSRKGVNRYIERCRIAVGNLTIEQMKSNYNIKMKGGVNGE